MPVKIETELKDATPEMDVLMAFDEGLSTLIEDEQERILDFLYHKYGPARSPSLLETLAPIMVGLAADLTKKPSGGTQVFPFPGPIPVAFLERRIEAVISESGIIDEKDNLTFTPESDDPSYNTITFTKDGPDTEPIGFAIIPFLPCCESPKPQRFVVKARTYRTPTAPGMGVSVVLTVVSEKDSK